MYMSSFDLSGIDLGNFNATFRALKDNAWT